MSTTHSTQKVIVTANEFKIKTAQDAIDAAFRGLRNHQPQACTIDATLKEIGFEDPKKLPDAGKVQESFVTLVTEKILERLSARVAIIIDETPKCACRHDKQKINYLVVTNDPEEIRINQANHEVEKFGSEASDGVIEDLIGPIEVIPTTKETKRPKLV